ncbi:hypothetical protein [Burkholderia gladioli]|uniref:hypothetical protein n=1 Tax=Burkholderia gladioli TaxID=28095 RepID=UPI0012D40BD1|nr:hypothetical protein [Burkholderia gladioli]
MSKKIQEITQHPAGRDVHDDAVNDPALYTFDHWENDAFLMRGQTREERLTKHFEWLKASGASPEDNVVHPTVRDGYRKFLSEPS